MGPNENELILYFLNCFESETDESFIQTIVEKLSGLGMRAGTKPEKKLRKR